MESQGQEQMLTWHSWALLCGKRGSSFPKRGHRSVSCCPVGGEDRGGEGGGHLLFLALLGQQVSSGGDGKPRGSRGGEAGAAISRCLSRLLFPGASGPSLAACGGASFLWWLLEVPGRFLESL